VTVYDTAVHVAYTAEVWEEGRGADEVGLHKATVIQYVQVSEDWIKGEWPNGVASVGVF
jgi:hypothetical protein